MRLSTLARETLRVRLKLVVTMPIMLKIAAAKTPMSTQIWGSVKVSTLPLSRD